MLEITINGEGHGPYNFHWNGSPDDLQKLWNDLEASAATRGHDPIEVANATIATIAAEGPAENESKALGQTFWIIYAVLRGIADKVDLDSLGRKGPEMAFEVAAHQHVTANILAVEDGFEISLAGRAQLDS